MWDTLVPALDKETSPLFKNILVSLISFDPTSLIQSSILSQNDRNAMFAKTKKIYHDQLVTVVSQSSAYKTDHKRIQ